MASVDWSNQYTVLSISQLEVRETLGFTTEQVGSLTDGDMEQLAERLQPLYFRSICDEHVRFITAPLLEEGRKRGGQDE